jgi:hypothetical protein
LATVTGTVTDASGAVIANAPIEVKNRDNGAVITAASSSTGNFTVSQLPVGDYDLEVKVTGFKAYEHKGFHLAAQQTMREDISLQVGSTNDSVTITAEASLLKTESSEIVNNVTLSQLNNLPILAVGATNSGFRDPFASVRLVPGVQYTNGTNAAAGATGATTTMVINGTPGNTYGTRLDGMTMNPTGPRLIGAQMQTQPSTDAIQEVAMQTSNFAAEYGTAGGAMINMVTKSGTNEIHGSLYDYGTNEGLNARQAYTNNRSKIRQTDWGFTVGGPVYIPKLYDGRNKTFFFWSYEQFRQKNLLIANATVPVAAYRNGDFSNLITAENRLVTTAAGPALDSLGRQIPSGTIYDPLTQGIGPNGVAYRDPFPGNKIPVSRFDPVSAKVLALVPAPLGVNFNRGLFTSNYTNTYDSSRHSNIPSVKFDQILGAKGRVSFYMQETNTNVNTTPSVSDPFQNEITQAVGSFSSGTTIRLNYDYAASARLLIHGGIGWNDSDFILESNYKTYDTFKNLGLVGQAEGRYFPRIVTAASTNDQIGGMSPLGTNAPTASFERRPSATASASYVTGRHTFKIGFDWRNEKFPNYPRSGGLNTNCTLTGQGTNTTGTYCFGQNYTQTPSLIGQTISQGFSGFEFASFLLGGYNLATQVAPIALANSKSQSAIFLQDTWKVTRKMTFDYGVRWDYGTYAREQYGRNASVGLAVPNPSASGRPGALQYEALCKCNFASNYPFAIGPRLGLAYQINSKTVVRAGWGVVYNATVTSSGSASATSESGALPNNSGLIAGQFKDGLPSGVRATWPSFNAAAGQGVGQVVAMPQLLDANAGRPARLMQWNISVQREINRNLVVEGAYVGNRGIWWGASGAFNASSLATFNTLSETTLRSLGFTDFTSTSESALLTTPIQNLSAAQRNTLASRGISLTPYANFPATQTVRQSLLALPQYTGTGLAGAPLGNTWYDSFQLNVTKRYSHGLALNVNYTFSKTLDTMSNISDVYNRGLSKNISANDLPHQFRFTAQYVVPDLKNSFIPGTKNGVVAYLLSDWGLGAYLSYQSAPMLVRPTSNGTLPISNFLGRGPGGAQLKKNADGTYMNPWSVDWTDYDGNHHTDPLDINCHCYDPTKTVAFNPAAWENIPNGQWGADQSRLRFYRGVRVPSENVNFSRNFKIAREGRISLNIRVEFNNIFNRLILPNPVGATVASSFAAQPTKFTSGQNAGLYSGGFGTFNVLSGVGNQRTGTYVARLTF